MIGLRIRLLVLASLLAVSLSGEGWGQAAKGGISGRVTVSDIGGPVPGATVSVEGIGVTVEADRDGQFFIPDLDPGRYDLLVSKDGAGLLSERITGVAVTGGSISQVSPELEAEIVELDVYELPPDDLQGGEDLAAAALSIQRSLPDIANVIDKELLSKGGSSDVGGALTKGAGISVVDSRYVVVRGLSDRYNIVTLNGARLPSPDPDRRAVNVDIFPNNLVENLVARKTFSPPLSGESTGGNIDIITRSIPKESFGKVSVGVGVDTMATNRENFLGYLGAGPGFLGNAEDRAIPIELKNLQIGDPFDAELQRSVSSQIGKSMGGLFRDSALDSSFSGSTGYRGEFMGRPAGILGAVTYKKGFDYDDQAISQRASFSTIVGELVESRFEEINATEELRAGMLLSGGVELEEGGRLGVLYFGNIAVDDQAFFRRGGTAEVGGVDIEDFADPNLEYIVNESIAYRERTLSAFQAFGSHRLGADKEAKVDWVASYNQATQIEPDIRIGAYKVLNSGARYLDLSAAEFNGLPFERIWQTVEDSSFNVQVDSEIPLFDTGAEKMVKLLAGGAFDSTRRDFVNDSFRFGSQVVRRLPRSGPLSPTFMLPVSPDDRVGRTPADVLPLNTATGIATFALSRSVAPTTYFAEQNTLAFYSMFDIDVNDRLNVKAGARVEVFDLKIGRNFTDEEIGYIEAGDFSKVNVITRNVETGEPLPPEEIIAPVEINKIDLMPAFAWDYKVSEKVKLRGALSRTAARPSFKEVAPIATRRIPDGDVFLGNRDLRTSQISNYDVRVEYEPELGDLAAFTVFSKQIQDPIELRELGTERFFINEPFASVYGFEIEGQKELGDFAPWLDGVAAGLNYARIVSSVELSEQSAELRRAIGGGASRRLQGQPDYTFNFNLTYKDENIGLFTGLFLNVTGESVALTGGPVSNAFTGDVFQRPLTTLNFTLEKSVTDFWTLSLKATNLTGSPNIRAYELGTLRSYDTRSRGYSISLKGDW